MSDYDNTNSGALFKNDHKESERHPDYRGEINVAGTDYWLSAWLKESKGGKKYMSLAVKPKEQKEAAPQQAPAEDFDDDIPF